MPRVVCPRCKEQVFIEGVAYGERAECTECGRTFVLRKTKDGRSVEHSTRRPVQTAASALWMAASCLFIAVFLGFVGAVIVFGVNVVTAFVVPEDVKVRGGVFVSVFVLFLSAIGPAKYAIIVHGARKMDYMSSYGWAVVAALFAILDILLFPFGIWAMIVLLRPQTRAMFKAGQAT